MAEEVRAFYDAENATAKKNKGAKQAAITQGTGATTTQEEGGSELTTGHGIEDIAKGTDRCMTSAQFKWPHGTKRAGPQKNTKASKLDNEPITLTEGDLYYIGDTVCEVTRVALQEAMTE